jgi:hypothetical protein
MGLVLTGAYADFLAANRGRRGEQTVRERWCAAAWADAERGFQGLEIFNNVQSRNNLVTVYFSGGNTATQHDGYPAAAPAARQRLELHVK